MHNNKTKKNLGNQNAAKDKTKDTTLHIRCTTEEKNRIVRAAKKSETKKVSDFIRVVMLKECEKYK